MSFMLRAAALVAATVFTFGCKPKPEVGTIEACHIKMTAPDAQEWTTYWSPKGRSWREAGGAASSVFSPVWANAYEREEVARTGGSQLGIFCGVQDAKDNVELGLALSAADSTDKDIPMGPGIYRIIPKSREAQPGTFISGTILLGKSMFTASGGTVKIDRFDMNGVAGSFVVDGDGRLTGSRPLHVEGTFDIPCRAGRHQYACTANEAVARE